MSPEVAAHFGGLNPFAGGDAEPADVSEQAEPEDTVPELEPLPLPETTEEPAESPEETEPQPQPEEPQEKKSHSSRNSGYHRSDRTAAVRSPPVTVLILSVRIQTSADKVFINDFKQINIFDFGTLVDPVH